MNKPKYNDAAFDVEYKKRKLWLSITIEQLELMSLAVAILPNKDPRRKRAYKIVRKPLSKIVMELREIGLNNQTFRIDNIN